MTDTKWRYYGDVSIRHGGVYIRDDEIDQDICHIVEVIPLSDAGGPDNLFRVLIGTLDLDVNKETVKKALDVRGQTLEEATRDDIALALANYSSYVYHDEDVIVQIGKPCEYWSGREENNPEPNYILRAGVSLRNWVEKNYTHKVKQPRAPAP